jgi:uncharacterized coiled-coil protein SlyX
MKNWILILCYFFTTWETFSQVVLKKDSQDILISKTNSDFDAHALNKDTSRYWIKTSLIKQSDQQYLLECLAPHLNDLVIHLYNADNKLIQHYESGNKLPFYQRSLKHKNFVFPLPNEKGNYTVWIGLKNYRDMDLYFKIRSFTFFTEYALSEYFFLGLYYGILLIVFLYNLFIYLKGKFKLHLLYSFYILGCIIISIKEDGLAYQFIWSGFPAFNQFMILKLAKPLFLVTFTAYASSFLQIRLYRPIIITILKSLVAGFILLSVLQLSKLAVLSELIYFGTFLIVYFSSFYISSKGSRPARYFFLGFSMVILSVLLNILRVLDIFPSNILTVYSFNFGIILEVIIFSLALADWFRNVNEEKNKTKEELIIQLQVNDQLQKDRIIDLEEKKHLQEKVNLELETRVQERTIELEEANQKLRDFSQKMEKMGSELDKHNYQLRKEISQQKLSRVHEKEVPYAEFLKIYESDETCLRLLSKLKWDNGYTCRKCGNEKAVNNPATDKKKCSKCGYIESVTANTLFHHLKFPVNKAFYLTYIGFSGIRYTNDQLSEIISLRKSTIWTFRNKVSERLKQKEYSKIKNWQDMVVDKG